MRIAPVLRCSSRQSQQYCEMLILLGVSYGSCVLPTELLLLLQKT